jgi:hypothetical protein
MKTFYLRKSILVAALFAVSFAVQGQGIYQKNNDTENVGNGGNNNSNGNGSDSGSLRAGGTENDDDGGGPGKITPVGDGAWVMVAGSFLFGLVVWKREKKKGKKL